MKRYILPVMGIAIASVCLTSCKMNVLRGEGKKGTVDPAVSSFNAIDVDVQLKAVVNVQPGSQPSVQFAGYENILQHIKTKVENNTLTIYDDLDETWNIEDDNITAVITVPSLQALSLSGAQEADVHGSVTGQQLNVEMSGASEVRMDNVNVDSFFISVSGAGDVDVKGGNVKYAEYEIDGAGTVKAFPLQASEANATISGAGTGELTSLQKLSANISGAGTIKYKGHPVISQDVSGAGTLKDAN